MNIKLQQQPYEEVGKKIYEFMINEPGIKEIFSEKCTRLIASEFSLLIKLDDIPIGFINLVPENLDNILFLDMGICEKYRGKGYGKKAIKVLLECLGKRFSEYIIGETKETNELANYMSNEDAALIYQKNGYNYYIFPKEKKNEFMNSELYTEFKEHCGNVPTKKKTLR